MSGVKQHAPADEKRPAHPTDFDINVGLHNLKTSVQTDCLTVWKAPLWENIVCFVFLLIALVAGYLVRTFNPELFDSTGSGWDMAARILVAGLLFLGVWFFLVKCLHRARLELDHDAGCLLFYRRLVFPTAFYRIHLSDIATVRKCTASDRGSGDDSTPWTYTIVAAQLKTGESVSIAFDSSPNILSEIRKALPART